MSKNESLLLSSLSEKSKTIFNLKDIVAEAGCSYKNAKVLVNRLVKKKWLIVLKRGVYLIVPLNAGAKARYTEHEFVIASHLVSPYYIAYWSALNFHGFTDQVPFTVFVATTKRARNREILNARYNFVTLDRKKFFGFAPAAVSTYRINIADREKSLADALDHPEFCGGISEAAKCLWNAKEKASLEKIARYAKRMENSAIVKRLGYLAEALNIKIDASMLSKMRKSVSPGMSVLDPTMLRKGRYTTRWNLLVNVTEEALKEWRRGF